MMVPRLLILVIWQVRGLLMEVRHTGGKAGCLGVGKVMYRFPPDVWEIVSSLEHVLNGRGWRTASN